MIENIPAEIWTQSLNEYQIFDVRTPAEWAEGVLQNARCVALYDDLGSFNTNFVQEIQSALDGSDKILAFICRSGGRSEIAARIVLDELGIRGVNLDGGMLALEKEA
ncbi:rhodanese-like domain-containing protein [Campylobacter sp.]|uniref:rhodanese-like domain-containing protein n=1 Tax=Campylobacter sp. TaxID=205 RepID=UPI0026DC663C|nr:rhodanese-like domain-containing protein [Campylobacter sp.]MDO4673855.1 rhodanese-like domain-containing protein [Campylobacter sp.]